MAEFRLSNFTDGAVLTAAELNTGLTYADYTPVWTQGITITHTKTFARFTQFGKMVVASIRLLSTTAGTAGDVVKVTLPVNASSNNYILGHVATGPAGGQQAGRYALFDTSTTAVLGGAFSGTLLLVNTTAQIANAATLTCTLVYEAA